LLTWLHSASGFDHLKLVGHLLGNCTPEKRNAPLIAEISYRVKGLIFGRNSIFVSLRSTLYSFVCILLCNLASSQVQISHNLPPAVPASSQADFTVTINKDNYTGFANYMLKIPEGLTFVEVNLSGGGLTVKGDELNVTWPVMTSKPSTVSIVLRVLTGPATQSYTIPQKFTFIKDDTRNYVTPDDIQFTTAGTLLNPDAQDPKEVEMQVMQLKRDAQEATRVGNEERKKAQTALAAARADSAIAAGLSPGADRDQKLSDAGKASTKAINDLATAEKIISLSAELRGNAEQIERLNKRTTEAQQNKRTADSLKKSDNTAGAPVPKDRIKMKQQATQMKRDATEAYSVGTSEKVKAEKRLSYAREDLKLAPEIADSSTRKYAITKANFEKSAAEADLAVAEKILRLARTLEQNADELEKSLPPEKPKGKEKEDKPAVASKPANAEKPAVSEKPVSTEKPAKEKEEREAVAANPPATAPDGRNEATGANKITDSGTVWFIQVGAFQNQPDLSALRNLQPLTVVTEGGYFKVLSGKYRNRGEAAEKCNRLKQSGIDAFVISYTDGVRGK
jgi:hypothetical protein